MIIMNYPLRQILKKEKDKKAGIQVFLKSCIYMYVIKWLPIFSILLNSSHHSATQN